ncbi:AraC family ligand binding domain-containing protein, partial [Pseudomonas aeruginosa]
AGERLEVGRGDVLVLTTSREHAYAADSQPPWSIYWVHFEGGLAEDFLRPLGSAPRLRLGMHPRLLAEFDALLALRRQVLSLPHFIHAAHLLQGLRTSLAVRP